MKMYPIFPDNNHLKVLSDFLTITSFQAHLTEANLKSTYEKNEKFVDSLNGASKALLPVKIVNDIMKGDENIAINVEEREPDNTTALLSSETGNLSPERYPTSEFHQFWVVLKRTLLFSRRDWVNPEKGVKCDWSLISFVFHRPSCICVYSLMFWSDF
jgi:hypothetical protein